MIQFSVHLSIFDQFHSLFTLGDNPKRYPRCRAAVDRGTEQEDVREAIRTRMGQICFQCMSDPNPD